MGLRFLKVIPKTNKILKEDNIIASLALIKIIARCIKENITIIYFVESAIINLNNNLKTYNKPRTNLYSYISTRKKINLIMAIYEDDLIYYQLREKNIDENIFLSFVENMTKKIIEKKNNKLCNFNG